jgi:drug/metabolite transporter (DMT)-like permease
MSVFFFALMNVTVKLIAGVHSLQIVFFRSLVSLLVCLVILWRNKIYFWGRSKKYLILRGSLGATSLIMYFWLLQQVPLAVAATFQMLSPLFTALFAFFFLKENLSFKSFLFFLVSTFGVFFIYSPNDGISIFETIIGIVTAITSALAYICIRKMGNSENPLVIILYFPLIATPISGILMIPFWVDLNAQLVFMLILIGLLTQAAQFYMTKAYQVENAAKVANVNYLGLVFSLIFGYFIFNELLSLRIFKGICIITTGLLLNYYFSNKIKNQVL